ncbi:hypothetical protein BJ508DRAFT_314266 [Ascobolus immersus RN42]|uniref:Uncharacterized protein n=1 Tax=Ascobolus immersus RN42 TaxID=1160509 RepID=A0A3N4HM69_ASCIM|nr:hypothetical protein BJ508DRAFT_314266 [Ascobolus immersus RN42]
MQIKLTVLNILALLAVADFTLLLASPAPSPSPVDGKVRGWFQSKLNGVSNQKPIQPEPVQQKAENTEDKKKYVPLGPFQPLKIKRGVNEILKENKKFLAHKRDWPRSPEEVMKVEDESELDQLPPREWEYFKSAFLQDLANANYLGITIAQREAIKRVFINDIVKEIDWWFTHDLPILQRPTGHWWFFNNNSNIIFALLTQEMLEDRHKDLENPFPSLKLLVCGPDAETRFVLTSDWERSRKRVFARNKGCYALIHTGNPLFSNEIIYLNGAYYTGTLKVHTDEYGQFFQVFFNALGMLRT